MSKKNSNNIKCPNCGTVINLSDFNIGIDKVKEQAEIEKLVNERVTKAVNEKVMAAKKETAAKYEKQIEKLKTSNAQLERDIETNESRFKEKERLWKTFNKQKNNKMYGEDLEQWCLAEFEKIHVSGFPKARFDKDNDISINSKKADFIFRNYDDNGNEFVSIIFDMKNEDPDSKIKQKNEKFYQKLDEDRTTKNCEYAVLVSTLEEDSLVFNQGIVDVSYKYPKMFVVRPDFFLTIIIMINNLAKDKIELNTQLIEIQNRDIDIEHFKEQVIERTRILNKPIKESAKSLDDLDKIGDNLIKQGQNLKNQVKNIKSNFKLIKDTTENLSLEDFESNSPQLLENYKKEKNKEE